MVDAAAAELVHRQGLWSTLIADGGTKGVAPARLRQLGIYGGAQGIWVDKARTASIDPDGVTVGVLHTGSSYADDLYDGGVLYHYPTTGRGPGRDASEVAATKTTRALGLPIFVISYPTPGSARRNVDLAWVEDWDDNERLFLITFGDAPPSVAPPADDETEPFEATADRAKKQSLGTVRPGQHRFKFRVLRRYGAACAVCDVGVETLLDAAHIRGYRDRGSDDERNGIVLCALHHRAFDGRLFGIEPGTTELQTRAGGPSLEELRITRPSLTHLQKQPHEEVLAWRWAAQRWDEGAAEPT
jgi:hypothetical protein